MLRLTASFLSCLLLAAALQAADMPEFPPPTKEHEWLKQLIGEWSHKSEANMGPGQPAMQCEGRETVAPLGGFWIVSNLNNNAGCMEMQGRMTIGYDPKKQKYVGTWQDSATSTLWIYEGSVDPTGKILTLESEGPNFMAGGQLTKFRDITEFKSPDHRVTKSEMLGADGKWVTFMTGEAKRVKDTPKPL
jgi:hypothetical protein